MNARELFAEINHMVAHSPLISLIFRRDEGYDLFVSRFDWGDIYLLENLNDGLIRYNVVIASVGRFCIMRSDLPNMLKDYQYRSAIDTILVEARLRGVF